MRFCGVWKAVSPVLVATSYLLAPAARASSLEISPVSINLAAGQNTTIVELTNRGDKAVVIQVRPYGWSQSGDTDALAPTKDLILSPPIFTIAAGASQTLRLLFRGSAGRTAERTYRLLLDEVPPADAQANQIGVALRLSLPVFAAPTAPPSRAISWHAERGPDNTILLAATNSGNVYDKVETIAVTLPDGSHPKVIASGSNPYILVGTQRHWVVQAPARGGAYPSGKVQLTVETQAGKSDVVLALDR